MMIIVHIMDGNYKRAQLYWIKQIFEKLGRKDKKM